MGVNFSDYEAALRMRTVIDRMVADQVEKLRPKYQYATVTEVHSDLGHALVIYPGDLNPVQVRLGSGIPLVGQTVRVEGASGDRYIADVMAAATAPGSTAMLWEKEFSASGELTVGTEPGARIYNTWSRNITLTALFLSVADAPTGADIQINLFKNDIAIFPTSFGLPSIAAGATSHSYDLNGTINLVAGDNLRCQILQVGSTFAGKNLTVQVLGHTV